MTSTTSLIPSRRLGALLRHARLAAARELVDVGRSCGLSVVELDDIELGRRSLDEATLAAVVAAYGLVDTGVVPERSQLVIDLDEGCVAVGPSDIRIGADCGPDAILVRYLALVHRLRNVPLGTPLAMRDADVEVLSAALALAADDVDHRLLRLMSARADVAADQRRIRRQLLLPLVGVVVASTGLGTLVLVTEGGTPPDTDISTPAVAEAPVVTDLGTGGAVEFNTDD